jgi:hypothetical protein
MPTCFLSIAIQHFWDRIAPVSIEMGLLCNCLHSVGTVSTIVYYTCAREKKNKTKFACLYSYFLSKNIRRKILNQFFSLFLGRKNWALLSVMPCGARFKYFFREMC